MRLRLLLIVAMLVGTVAGAAVRVDITPTSASVLTGGSVQFDARVSGTSPRNRAVFWTATCGTITGSGFWTTTTPCVGTVRATATTGAFAEASVTVSDPPPPEPDPEPTPDPTPTTCSDGGVVVTPGNVGIMASYPAGTIYCVSGNHTLTAAIVPKDGDTLLGIDGGTLSGARLLSGFTFDGLNHSVGGQTVESATAGTCFSDAPRCHHNEELFLDGIRLRHVSSRDALTAGAWFFDYPADRVYLRDNPTGRRVDLSVTPYALSGSAANVTIAGLTVEMFANPAQSGAIRGEQTRGWTVRDSAIHLNHGIGLRVGTGMQVLRNAIVRNGQMGIGGSGSAMLVEGNEIAWNNEAGFNYFWEAGGSKFTYSTDLVLRGNWAHHNDGSGLWTDINNNRVLVEDNLVEDNTNNGVFHEISYACTIRRNTVRRNGTDRPYPGWVEGAGIVISNAGPCEVYGNTLTDNWQQIALFETNRGSGSLGTYTTQHVHVYDNVTILTALLGSVSGRTVGIDTSGTNRLFNGTNTFDRNQYRVPSCGGQFWAWGNLERTWAAWQGLGLDLLGSCGSGH